MGDILSGCSRCPLLGVEYKDIILCITAMGLEGKVELDNRAPPTGMETSWPQQVTVAPLGFHLPLGPNSHC